jgi:TRIAD3 protein (E3 ubiquitin-protein ligase RNF216)
MTAAQILIGQLNTHIKCLSSAQDCKYMVFVKCLLKFSNSEIKRFLPEKEFEAFQTISQNIEIDKAKIIGFEKCPFCPFGIIFPENNNDELFICQREGCKIISCRHCKKVNHAPILCDDKVEDAVHSVGAIIITYSRSNDERNYTEMS